MSSTSGVQVPLSGERRSSTALGRGVVADALREVDPAGAEAALSTETSAWRTGYAAHFRRLTTAGLVDASAAERIAADGLGSLHARMRWVGADGREIPLADLDEGVGRAMGTAADAEVPATVTVRGTAGTPTELTLPHRGRTLRGAELLDQVARWVRAGVAEPEVLEAVSAVQQNPHWLSLPGRTAVLLGAASEMGPLEPLLRWGADVAALDLPRADLWDRLVRIASRGAGTLLAPVGEASTAPGVDLLTDLPRAAAWIDALAPGGSVEAPQAGSLVLGNHLYADGVLNLRLAAAADALTAHLLPRHPSLALAGLATPTDVFAVPEEAVAQARRSPLRRDRRWGALRRASGGRLMRPAYDCGPGGTRLGEVPPAALPAGSGPALADVIVTPQGPNYLLAKRLHRWRATLARAQGHTVSFRVAPPTATVSVLHNRTLAAAYAGAGRFGLEVFEPPTARTLMAALMVHDLYAAPTSGTAAPTSAREVSAGHPWQHEAAGAVHGGLWRCGLDPVSVFPVAAVAGMIPGAVRRRRDGERSTSRR